MHIRIDIPSRPEVLLHLSAELKREEPSIAVIADIISDDVGLAAGVLSLANSPRFAGAGKLSSIKEAAIFLGLDTLIAFATNVLFKKTLGTDSTMLRFFWEKSNAIADECVDVLRCDFFSKYHLKPSEIYTYGLFRDCGQAVLLLNFHEYLSLIGSRKIDCCDLLAHDEMESFGVAHPKPGFMLCYYWGLSECICNSVRDHHDSSLYHIENHQAPSVQTLFMSIGHFAHIRFLLKKSMYDVGVDHILPVIIKNLMITDEQLNEIIGQKMPTGK